MVRAATREEATPPQEPRDKRHAFEEAASRRYQQSVTALQRLGQCANKQSYQYEDAEAERMLDLLQAELDRLRAAFLPKATLFGGK